MKTVEELAHKNAESFMKKVTPFSTMDMVYDCAKELYIAGYNKAKEWISVEEEFPEIPDDGLIMYSIICKKGNNIELFALENEDDLKIIKRYYTHWKYID